MDSKSIVLDDRLISDLEMIIDGFFKPLDGFMNQNDYESVLNDMRLVNGNIWSIPIVLPIPEDSKIDIGDEVLLRDKTNLIVAKINVESKWKPNLERECLSVFQSYDDNHFYIKQILERKNMFYIGGKVTKIGEGVKHYDFIDLRKNVNEIKQEFEKKEWNKDDVAVVAFQTRNPMHRSHFELTKYALQEVNNKYEGTKKVKLLLSPIIALSQPNDVPYHLRFRCYKKMLSYYGKDEVILASVPLAMRMAGPKEALLHAIIRKNMGATEFIIGRDHAGPSEKKKNGEPFFDPYDAQELVEKYADEIGIKLVTSKMIVYVEEKHEYMPIDKVPKGMTIANISGTEQRRMLRANEEIPQWFSFPEIVNELRKEMVSEKDGLCLYFVGLSGCGKSTLAEAVKARIIETQSKKITILDGDVVRLELSKGLGFDRQSRSTNVRRIGYVASEITKHGGTVFCANIAPYEEDRTINRERIRAVGKYVEIYVKTDLSICEERDIKGLYKLAREGKIKEFTGISDPFEEPINADLVVNGGSESISKNVDIIIDYLAM